MESNKKMVLIGGLVLVLIFGVFGTYLHFTKQDIIISSEKKADKSNELNSNDEGSKKENEGEVSDSSNENESASKVDSQSKNDTKKEASVENKSNNTESDTNNEKTTNSIEDEFGVTYESYTVVKGDTLSSIWRKNIVSYPFSIAREMIINKNEMSAADQLKPGQTLEIPIRDSKGYTKYSVKEGDNLTRIAEKLFPNKEANEVIEAITKANGSENVENVEIDQVLLIPSM